MGSEIGESIAYLIVCAILFWFFSCLSFELALFIMVPIAVVGVLRILLGADGLISLILAIIVFLVVCFIVAIICATLLGLIVSFGGFVLDDKIVTVALFVVCPIIAFLVLVFLLLLSGRHYILALTVTMFLGLLVYLLLAIVTIAPVIGIFAALKWFIAMLISIIVSFVIVSSFGEGKSAQIACLVLWICNLMAISEIGIKGEIDSTIWALAFATSVVAVLCFIILSSIGAGTRGAGTRSAEIALKDPVIVFAERYLVVYLTVFFICALIKFEGLLDAIILSFLYMFTAIIFAIASLLSIIIGLLAPLIIMFVVFKAARIIFEDEKHFLAKIIVAGSMTMLIGWGVGVYCDSPNFSEYVETIDPEESPFEDLSGLKETFTVMVKMIWAAFVLAFVEFYWFWRAIIAIVIATASVSLIVRELKS